MKSQLLRGFAASRELSSLFLVLFAIPAWADEPKANDAAKALLAEAGKALQDKILGSNKVRMAGQMAATMVITVEKGRHQDKDCYKVTELIDFEGLGEKGAGVKAEGLIALDGTLISYKKNLTAAGGSALSELTIELREGAFHYSETNGSKAKTEWRVAKSEGLVAKEAQYVLMRLLAVLGKENEKYEFIAVNRRGTQETRVVLSYETGEVKSPEGKPKTIELTMIPKHPETAKLEARLKTTYVCAREQGRILSGRSGLGTTFEEAKD